MAKSELIIIGVLLLLGGVISIAAAQEEITYYILDENGGWREANPIEARYAERYINLYRELFPDAYSDRTWGPSLADYDKIPLPTPTPTPMPTPTIKPPHVPAKMPEGFWENITSGKLPSRNYSLPSRVLSRFR